MQITRETIPLFPIEVSERTYNQIETTLQLTFTHLGHLSGLIMNHHSIKSQAFSLNFHRPSQELARFVNLSCGLIATTVFLSFYGFDLGTSITRRFFQIRRN